MRQVSDMKHLTIFLFLLMGCTPQQKTNIIDLEVSLEKLTLNGQIIEKSDFERELKAIIDRKRVRDLSRMNC